MPNTEEKSVEAVLGKMLSVLTGLDDRLKALEKERHQQVVQVQQPPQQPMFSYQEVEQEAATLTPATYYWIRLKPFNKDLGHLRRGQYIDAIGKVLKGGTGQPGDIPEWVMVNPDVARKVVPMLQDPDRAHVSPFLCDVVTEEERQSIDAQEEAYRMSAAGMSAPPAGPPRQNIGRIRARRSTGNRPSIMAPPQAQNVQALQSHVQAPQVIPQGMQQIASQAQVPMPPQPVPPSQPVARAPIERVEPPRMEIPPEPANLGGRAAALQGLNPPQPTVPMPPAPPQPAPVTAPQVPEPPAPPPPPAPPAARGASSEGMDLNSLSIDRETRDAIKAAEESESAGK